MVESTILIRMYELAEEAAYSSKGHFKTANWLKISMNLTMGVPLITSLLTFGFSYTRIVNQLLSFFGLAFSFLALLFLNKNQYISGIVNAHFELGNDYLELYKEIRTILGNPSLINTEKAEIYQQKTSNLDKRSTRIPIGKVGRIWSKLVIRREMNLNWIQLEKANYKL